MRSTPSAERPNAASFCVSEFWSIRRVLNLLKWPAWIVAVIAPAMSVWLLEHELASIIEVSLDTEAGPACIV